MKTTAVSGNGQILPDNPFHIENGKIINVAFLIYDEVEAMDLNCPLDILSKANFKVGDFFVKEKIYNIYTVAASTKKIVHSEGGAVHMVPAYSYENAPQADILVVPGADPFTITKLCQNEPEMFDWIIQQNETTKVTMSVCSGSLLLSRAGILDGKKATTHYLVIDELKANRAIEVVENVRFVWDGKFITTAGVTSGIDGALFLVELIHGKAKADGIAHALIYNRSEDMSFMNVVV